MAAVQITGAVYPVSGVGQIGPFRDGSGNLWVFAFDSTPHVVAYKSSDSGATWGTTFATAATYGNFSLDCVYDGSNVVYVLVQNASHVLNILTFTISTTTWADTYVSGTKPTVNTDANSKYPAFLNRRSTGEYVAVYQGPFHSSTFRSVFWARCSSAGVWTAGAEVDAVNATVHYSLKGAVLGASNMTHMFFTNSSSAPTHRSVSSTNVLGTAASVSSSGVHSEIAYSAIRYDATAGLIWGACNATANIRFFWRATSTANPTFTVDANVASASWQVGTGSSAVIYSSISAKLYGFWQGTSSDLYGNSASGTTWGTEAALDVATLAFGVSVNSSSTGFDYVYGDSGVFYDSLAVSAAVTDSFAFTGGGYYPMERLKNFWLPKRRKLWAPRRPSLVVA